MGFLSTLSIAKHDLVFISKSYLSCFCNLFEPLTYPTRSLDSGNYSFAGYF